MRLTPDRLFWKGEKPMRSSCALGLALAVLLAWTPAYGQKVEKPAKPTTPPPAVVKVKAPVGWFAKHDANGDGKICLAEFKGPKDVFASIDADHNGYITRPEATRAYLAFVGLMTIQGRATAFKNMDVNHDGKLSPAEWKGRQPFAVLDLNKDGLIGRHEYNTVFRRNVGRAMVAYRIRSMDANKDGKIALSEWKGPKGAFARIDQNHDGYVVLREVRTILAARRANAPVPLATVAAKSKTPTPAPVKPVKLTEKPALAAKTPAPAKPPITLQALEKKIMAMDTNKNGAVCIAEFIAEHVAELMTRFAKLDVNKDGTITKPELAKACVAIYGNKAPTPAEVSTPKTTAKPIKPAVIKPVAPKPAVVKPASGKTAATPSPAVPSARVTRRSRYLLSMDANHDGKVCKCEYLKAVDARFSKIDVNKDGVITTTEITAFLAPQTPKETVLPVKAKAASASAKRAPVKVKAVGPPATAAPKVKVKKTAEKKG
jgi:Ca2+-binding EF-hand superfamily protein